MAFLMAAGVGAILAMLITVFIHENEFGRLTRLLREHDDMSDDRLKPGLFLSPGEAALVAEINSRLEINQGQRAAGAERSRTFQRNLANLSRDIHRPLDGARGYVKLAQDAVARDSIAAGHLAMAEAGLSDTSQLLDQVIAFAQVNDPDAQLDLQMMPILPILATALTRHQREFTERGWVPEVTFADEQMAAAVDEVALGRIFDNLAANALRHGTGTLRVEQSGRTLRFANAVSDPKSIDASKVFEQFYRAEASSDGSGAGLGLAMVAQLARLMGIKAAASVVGWEFVVTLEFPRQS